MPSFNSSTDIIELRGTRVNWLHRGGRICIDGAQYEYYDSSDDESVVNRPGVGRTVDNFISRISAPLEMFLGNVCERMAARHLRGANAAFARIILRAESGDPSKKVRKPLDLPHWLQALRSGKIDPTKFWYHLETAENTEEHREVYCAITTDVKKLIKYAMSSTSRLTAIYYLILLLVMLPRTAASLVKGLNVRDAMVRLAEEACRNGSSPSIAATLRPIQETASDLERYTVSTTGDLPTFTDFSQSDVVHMLHGHARGVCGSAFWYLLTSSGSFSKLPKHQIRDGLAALTEDWTRRVVYWLKAAQVNSLDVTIYSLVLHNSRRSRAPMVTYTERILLWLPVFRVLCDEDSEGLLKFPPLLELTQSIIQSYTRILSAPLCGRNPDHLEPLTAEQRRSIERVYKRLSHSNSVSERVYRFHWTCRSILDALEGTLSPFFQWWATYAVGVRGASTTSPTPLQKRACDDLLRLLTSNECSKVDATQGAILHPFFTAQVAKTLGEILRDSELTCRSTCLPVYASILPVWSSFSVEDRSLYDSHPSTTTTRERSGAESGVHPASASSGNGLHSIETPEYHFTQRLLEHWDNHLKAYLRKHPTISLPVFKVSLVA
ncbi:hypothetical protein GLOTRDRAFT_91277 [Gloeophyllum trabeum ATCC 11539]|uniref:Uncharacterized protein n=1 Tax=Gloeophyllum trabeum (strain ATCC 11539 / FP-39264 / Madison 617) TaxID=670483 RepID=S7QK85_GLOTA|nr:uncharacterized protein GLOTRDRAFT_91277 [Gloeophyllum trabeum ATCC 11539]EPQ59797.1 hypothetical protein GLOTRDRAFT_91277 [Gloeophyllum trabeum ATCC 11539]